GDEPRCGATAAHPGALPTRHRRDGEDPHRRRGRRPAACRGGAHHRRRHRGRRRRVVRRGRTRRAPPRVRGHRAGTDGVPVGARTRQGPPRPGAPPARPLREPGEGTQDMSNPDMMEALQALAAEKGISVDTLMAALADALESAYKRMPDAYEYAWVTIDPANFDIRVYAQ